MYILMLYNVYKWLSKWYNFFIFFEHRADHQYILMPNLKKWPCSGIYLNLMKNIRYFFITVLNCNSKARTNTFIWFSKLQLQDKWDQWFSFYFKGDQYFENILDFRITFKKQFNILPHLLNHESIKTHVRTIVNIKAKHNKGDNNAIFYISTIHMWNQRHFIFIENLTHTPYKKNINIFYMSNKKDDNINEWISYKTIKFLSCHKLYNHPKRNKISSK